MDGETVAAASIAVLFYVAAIIGWRIGGEWR